MNISSASGHHHRPDPAEFFKRADADGSGGISKDELKTMLENGPQKMSGAQAPSVDELFAAADTDGDGSISQSENEAAMKSMRPQHEGRSHSFSGSTEMLDSILNTLKSQDDGKDTSLTSDQRKLIEQLVTEMKNNGSAYNAQGTPPDNGSPGLFGITA